MSLGMKFFIIQIAFIVVYETTIIIIAQLDQSQVTPTISLLNISVCYPWFLELSWYRSGVPIPRPT